MMGYYSLFLLSQLAVFGLGSWKIGNRLFHRLLAPFHPALQIAFASAAGLMITSTVVQILVVCHFLSLYTLLGVYALLMLCAFSAVSSLGLAIRERSPELRYWIFPAVFLGVYYAWIFLAALLPALSVDELIYHLAVPKRILLEGGWSAFPNNIYAYFPGLADMFFIFGLGTWGEPSARIFHSLWGFLLALSIYGFARRMTDRPHAGLASALFLTIPSVMVIQSWAYVDLAYTLYAWLALAALIEGVKRSDAKLVAFAGLMAGGAFAVKYTGLQYSMILIVMLLILCLKQKKRLPIQGLAAALGLLMLPAAPYLWRNWQETGWPLYPFSLPGFSLHPGFNWDPERAQLFLAWLAQFGTPLGHESLLHSLVAPFLVFVLARLNSIPWYDGIIGPIFLLLPFGFRRFKADDHAKTLGIFSLLFLYYWAFTTKQVRFLLPVLPALCCLLAVGFSSFRSRGINILLTLYLCVMAGLGIYQVLKLKPIPFWTGRESRMNYIAERILPAKMYWAANQTLGPQDHLYLLNMKNYGYYLDHPFESDFIFERWNLDHALKQNISEAAVQRFFQDRNITLLLMDEGYIKSPDWGLWPAEQPVFWSFMKNHGQLLFRDGSYTLYRLK